MNGPDVTKIDEEESSLILPRFTNADAWWLGSTLRDMASELGAKAAIEVRKGTLTLFRSLLDGATQDNAGWLGRKLATAIHFERSSYAMFLSLQLKDVTLAHYGLDGEHYVAAGGAVPIRVAGVGVVGCVGISGLPQEQDHRLAIEALFRLRDHCEEAARPPVNPD